MTSPKGFWVEAVCLDSAGRRQGPAHAAHWTGDTQVSRYRDDTLDGKMVYTSASKDRTVTIRFAQGRLSRRDEVMPGISATCMSPKLQKRCIKVVLDCPDGAQQKDERLDDGGWVHTCKRADGTNDGPWAQEKENQLISWGRFAGGKLDGDHVERGLDGLSETRTHLTKGVWKSSVAREQGRETRCELNEKGQKHCDEVLHCPRGATQHVDVRGPGQRVSHRRCVRRDGTRHGPEIQWGRMGTVSHRGAWVDGKEDGRWTFYGPRGEVTMAGHYEAGKRTGRWVLANPDESWAWSGEFAQDVATGTWTWTCLDGRKDKGSGKVHAGRPVGKWSLMCRHIPQKLNRGQCKVQTSFAPRAPCGRGYDVRFPSDYDTKGLEFHLPFLDRNLSY